jgi:hypothetical protein
VDSNYLDTWAFFKEEAGYLEDSYTTIHFFFFPLFFTFINSAYLIWGEVEEE